ncbi:NHL repeat-containing protein [Hymenobacter sp. DG25A]|uniref:NHL repeat-containing protein n=1 Tax=Hymenobacter sp. DG25A TaxID=1385663 RepID=UPI0006C849EC|nr:NHL repeat-containing protein [Hymenobacter sp. DG25A]
MFRAPTVFLLALTLFVSAGCEKESPRRYGYTVSTLAGSTEMGYLDGVGTAARFDGARGIALDAKGNIYVAEIRNHRIRKITPQGVVTTVAGSGPKGKGSGGYADGLGATAQFHDPQGVAVDAQGNIYVTDGLNYRIRKISPAGMVSTLAGSGEIGYIDGNASVAAFEALGTLVLDKLGNLYVADGHNYVIRKVTPTGEVTTFAGSGVAGYADGPGQTAKFEYFEGLTIDAQGHIYVADRQNNRIRRVSPDGMVTTVAGSDEVGFFDGLKGEAAFSGPTGIAVDAEGTLYVADMENQAIRKISPAGVVSTIAGTGVPGITNGRATQAEFDYPFSITSDAQGTLYVTQQLGTLIRKIQRN